MIEGVMGAEVNNIFTTEVVKKKDPMIKTDGSNEDELIKLKSPKGQKLKPAKQPSSNLLQSNALY